MEPDNAVYLDTLAELYYRKKDYGKAIETIEKAIELDPNIRSLQRTEEEIRREKIVSGES
jgi:tetratricopeptide (TPR) repeat protein